MKKDRIEQQTPQKPTNPVVKGICKALKGLSTALVVVVLIIALSMVAPKAFGLDIYAVLSSSMEPDYKTGSLIYVKKDVDAYNLEVGTDITYALASGTTATHRIVEVFIDEDTGEKMYRTQGIANENPDATPVHPRNIIGCPIMTIPQVGVIAIFLQSQSGLYISIAVIAGIFWLMILPDLICPEESKSKKKKEKNNDPTPDEEKTNENVQETKEEIK